MRPKTEAHRKREAKEQAEAALSKTLKKFSLGRPGPLRGAIPSPLAAEDKRRDPNSPPTSDRIPGSAPASDLLHAHKWKRGAEETTVTTCEMIKKSSANSARLQQRGAAISAVGIDGKNGQVGRTQPGQSRTTVITVGVDAVCGPVDVKRGRRRSRQAYSAATPAAHNPLRQLLRRVEMLLNRRQQFFVRMPLKRRCRPSSRRSRTGRRPPDAHQLAAWRMPYQKLCFAARVPGMALTLLESPMSSAG